MTEPTLLQQARLFLESVDDQETPQWQAQDCMLQILESWVAKALPLQPMSVGYEREAAMREPAQVPGFDELLKASSFGTPDVEALSAQIPNEVVQRIVARADELAAESADLDELQRLCDAATPGPWTVDGAYVECPLGTVAVCTDGATKPQPEACFMAAARDALPKLIAEVRRLRVQLGGEHG